MSDVALVKAIQESTVATPKDTVIVYETGMEVEVHRLSERGKKSEPKNSVDSSFL